MTTRAMSFARPLFTALFALTMSVPQARARDAYPKASAGVYYRSLNARRLPL